MKKISRILLAAALSTGFFTQAAHAVDGAYNSIGKSSMTISAPNTWYTMNFPTVAGNPPVSNTTITVVYYSFQTGQQDIGTRGTLTVLLCQGSTSNCVDVTSAQSGSTRAFEGKPTETPFFLYYKVAANKAFPSRTGSGTTQVTVNWKGPQ